MHFRVEQNHYCNLSERDIPGNNERKQQLKLAQVHPALPLKTFVVKNTVCTFWVKNKIKKKNKMNKKMSGLDQSTSKF